MLGLSHLFVAHDLAVVEHISCCIAVMYLGKIVEIADKTAFFTRPQHPYTEALPAAVPVPDPEAARKRIIVKRHTAACSAEPPRHAVRRIGSFGS